MRKIIPHGFLQWSGTGETAGPNGHGLMLADVLDPGTVARLEFHAHEHVAVPVVPDIAFELSDKPVPPGRHLAPVQRQDFLAEEFGVGLEQFTADRAEQFLGANHVDVPQAGRHDTRSGPVFAVERDVYKC